eukprot:188412_1
MATPIGAPLRSGEKHREEKPAMQGFIWKQDSDMSTAYTIRGRREWKRRWAVVLKGTLKCYRVSAASTTRGTDMIDSFGKENNSKKISNLLGVVTLSAGTRVFDGKDSPEKKKTREHMFYIQRAEVDIWFSAPDAHLRKQWLTAIQSCIIQTKKSSRKDRQVRKFPWEIPYQCLDVREEDKLGEGMFGDVYRGTMWGTEVAIKKLKSAGQEIQDQVIADLRKEANILQSLRHPNVVLYMGFCPQPHVCIITEFCSKGSLFDILYDHEIILNFKRIIQIARGITRGMNYLHCLERKIIHRDLKSQNVLVADDWTPKICDFGISHVRRKVRTLTLRQAARSDVGHYGVYGTPEWMAPEVLEGVAYNETADVYSFGIVMCELLTRELPFRDRYVASGSQDIIDCILEDGAIPTIPPWVSSSIRNMIEWCLHRNPAERPKFRDLIEYFTDLFSKESDTWLLKYDVPRLKHMFLSEELTAKMLACREFRAIVSDSRSQQIPPAEMEWLISAVKHVLLVSNPHVQLDAVEALLAVFVNGTESALEAVFNDGTFNYLLKLINFYETNTEAKGVAVCVKLIKQCRVLLSDLAQDVSKAKGIEEFVKVSMDKAGMSHLEIFRSIIRFHLRSVADKEAEYSEKENFLKQLLSSADSLSARIANAMGGTVKSGVYLREAGIDRKSRLEEKKQSDREYLALPDPPAPPNIPTPPTTRESVDMPEPYEKYFRERGEPCACAMAEVYVGGRTPWVKRFLVGSHAQLNIYASTSANPAVPIERIAVEKVVSEQDKRSGDQDNSPDSPCATLLRSFDDHQHCVSLTVNARQRIVAFGSKQLLQRVMDVVCLRAPFLD